MKLRIQIEYPNLTHEQLEFWMDHGAFASFGPEERAAIHSGHPVIVTLNPANNCGFMGRAIHQLDRSDELVKPMKLMGEHNMLELSARLFGLQIKQVWHLRQFYEQQTGKLAKDIIP